jgi:hypothetical protein
MACFAAIGLLAQMRANPNADAMSAAAGGFLFLIYFGFILLQVVGTIAGMWAVFVKAGEPGWAALVPIYNAVVLCRVAGMPVWWVILMCIPCVNIVTGLVFSIMVSINLAKRFSVGGGFVVGLILLPFIFYPILGFGSAEYEGRSRRKRRKVKPLREPEEEEDEDQVPSSRSRSRRRADDDYDEQEEEEDEAPEEVQPVRRRPAAPPPPPASSGKVACPECGATLRLPPDLPPGKRIRCPKCQTPFTTPS